MPHLLVPSRGVFLPPLFRPAAAGVAATALVDHTEASCFYHGQKQAVGVCDGCGRLVCALCSIDMGNEHLCPACISSGKKKGKLTTLEAGRTRYDTIALNLALVGCIPVAWTFSFITGPAAIYMAIRHWNSPGSILGVSRTRFVIALILGSIEVLVWIVLIVSLCIKGNFH